MFGKATRYVYVYKYIYLHSRAMSFLGRLCARAKPPCLLRHGRVCGVLSTRCDVTNGSFAFRISRLLSLAPALPLLFTKVWLRRVQRPIDVFATSPAIENCVGEIERFKSYGNRRFLCDAVVDLSRQLYGLGLSGKSRVFQSLIEMLARMHWYGKGGMNSFTFHVTQGLQKWKSICLQHHAALHSPKIGDLHPGS